MEAPLGYGTVRPTHKKLMVVGESRRSVLLQVLSLTDQYAVDDPVVIRCDGAQFVSELYIIVDERTPVEMARAMVMQV